MHLRWPAVLSLLLGAVASAATRPHYGGTLRVEVRDAIETPDPPQVGPGMANLQGAFVVSRWEAGRRAIYSADENAAGGRPYLDSVEIQMGRSLRDQAIDLELGRVDMVEMGSGEARRQNAGRKTWSSAPVRVMALVFGPRISDAHIREALALTVDRTAILNVLLQRQGEATGALLPQWLSGYAFLFPTLVDAGKARAAAAAGPASQRSFVIGVEDPGLRGIADRIALNARDAGLSASVTSQARIADVRLVEARSVSADPARALAGLAEALGLPAPGRMDTVAQVYEAERALLDGFRIVPLFHLSDFYGVSPKVKGGPGISPTGEWRLENLWLESARP